MRNIILEINKTVYKRFFFVVDCVYLELSLENIRCKHIKCSSTVSMQVNVDSVKAFALNDREQAFILSGPETESHGYLNIRKLMKFSFYFFFN